MGIINFGSMNLDHVYSLRHFVQPGETIQSEDYHIYSGGKGLNQSVATARAGAKVLHAGMAGKGSEMLLDLLSSCGVDTTHIGKSEAAQGHAIIQVSESGENCIILYPGSNACITEEYIDDLLSSQLSQYVMLQNEISAVPYIIDTAYKRGFRVVFNASPFDASIMDIDLRKIDWLLVNEIEGSCLTGEQEPEGILAKIRERSPETGIVLTLGKEGSLCVKGNRIIRQGIFPVPTVDTTAAGDTFTGYFVAGLDRGMELELAIRHATAASAIAVTRQGAAPSIPLTGEVSDFLMKMKQV